MKTDIHPKYVTCAVTCACGTTFETRSVLEKINVEICSQCHPFYTGRQKFVDTAGRIEKFTRKYAGFQATDRNKAGRQKAKAAAEPKKAEAKKPEPKPAETAAAPAEAAPAAGTPQAEPPATPPAAE